MKKLWISLLLLMALAVPAAWASDLEPTNLEPATIPATESLVEELEADASLQFLVAEFPLSQAIQQMSHSCTPDPCEDCYAERQCCINNCPSGNFNCIVGCIEAYRVCAFTCPNG